jgi:hypothetical protein
VIPPIKGKKSHKHVQIHAPRKEPSTVSPEYHSRIADADHHEVKGHGGLSTRVLETVGTRESIVFQAEVEKQPDGAALQGTIHPVK